jgi:hypothetical protein
MTREAEALIFEEGYVEPWLTVAPEIRSVIATGSHKIPCRGQAR